MKLYPITVKEEASRCLLCYDPPCSKACPSGSQPAAFLQALRFDNTRAGARRAMEDNLFGGICAAACPSSQYCEGACIRGKVDSPVQIALLQGYLMQQAAEAGFVPATAEPTGLRAAVLGASMAGLAAAAALRQAGAAVTVFADGPVWGAELLAQFTKEKLDTSLLQSTLTTLEALGVEIRAKETPAPAALKGYDAVIVAARKSLSALSGQTPPGTFFTGELLPGPNDPSYSVKKGRKTAEQALALLKKEEKNA